MKKLAAALGLVLGTATGLAGAAAFNLGGYTGPLVIQFRDFENISGGPIPAPGDQNFGVLRVTTVQDLSGNLLWTQGGSNGFLSGVFDGITVKSVTPAGAGHLNVQSTNGHMDLYLTDTALDPNQGTLGYGAGGCAVGGLCYHTVTDVGGVLFLSLDFAPGINPADGTITVNGDFNITTNPPSGTASSYLDVVGGVYASHFDTNFFPTNFGLRDLKIDNTFCPNGTTACGTAGNWQLQSSDPARAFFIPEPGTLALAGLALAFLGGMGRRRRG